jgi:hypothetical protein
LGIARAANPHKAFGYLSAAISEPLGFTAICRARDSSGPPAAFVTFGTAFA